MDELKGRIGERAVHLCIDMQRLFQPGGPWAAPWTEMIEPKIAKIVEQSPAHTIFTRFIPARSPNEARGAWRWLYEKWKDVTLENLDPNLVRLIDKFERYVPPGLCFDRLTYSAFADGRLYQILSERRVNTLIISGAETDVCVLATVLSAVDLGYRTIVVRDAIASSSDETHGALVKLYATRFSSQIELSDAAAVLKAWAADL